MCGGRKEKKNVCDVYGTKANSNNKVTSLPQLDKQWSEVVCTKGNIFLFVGC